MPSWTDCLEPQDWHDESYREVLQSFMQADWQASIGHSLENFPDELRLMVYQCFSLEHPLCIYWGRDLVQLYNPAFRDSFAMEQRSIGMGRPWLDAWGKEYARAEAVRSQFLKVQDDGRPVVAHHSQSFVMMNGELLEMFFNNTLSPIRDVNGRIKGVYCLLTDATDSVIAERRQKIIMAIGSTKSAVNSESEVAALIQKVGMSEPSDLPCLLGYHSNQPLIGNHDRTYSLVVCAGAQTELVNMTVGTVEAASWTEKPEDERDLRDYLLEAIHKRQPVRLTNSRIIESFCLKRAFGDFTRTVWLSPLFCHGEANPAGLSVQGLNPRRPQSDYSFVQQINDEIRAFLEIADKRTTLQNELDSRKAELAASQKRFEAMAKACPAGIFIMNLSTGEFEFVNDAYYEITGVPKSVGIDKWKDYIHPSEIEPAEKVWNEIETTPIMNFETRWIMPWRGDLERWTSSSAIIHQEDNGIRYVFGAFSNASPMRYALKAEKERADAAIATKHQQLEFLDMIAHELRNPLGAIMQTSDFLVEKMSEHTNPSRTFSEDDTEELKTIMLCAQHMSRIINDTLNLSKLEGGMLIATHVPTQPLAVVQSIIAMFDAEAKRNETSLQLQIDPSFEMLNVDWVLTDPSRLAQIIINFLANSIKFVGKMKTRKVAITLAASTSPMETKVQVNRRPSLQKPGSSYDLITPNDEERPLYLVCRVSDTGPGMSPEQVESLFQRYFQASPRTHVEYGGSGLGLFISKQLVTLLNGTIDVESVTDEGTTFSFSIKTVPCEAPKKEVLPTKIKHHPELQHDHSQRDTILIAEDNLINQKIMVKQLSNAGYLTLVANNGREVIDELKKDDNGARRVAICLCDIEMPVLGGIDTIKEVRRMEQSGELSDRCPFIAVTANARQEQVAAMIDAGMDDQVPKPLRFKSLLSKIAELLVRLGRPPLEGRRRSFLGTDTLPSSQNVDELEGHIEEDMIGVSSALGPLIRHRPLAQLWKAASAAQIQPFDLILLNTQSPRNISAQLWQRAGAIKGSLRVCTDGATDRLHKEVFNCPLESLPASERPDIVIGDLDSIAPSTKAFYEASSTTKVVQVEDQNSTDFTKAVKYITSTHGASDIIVLGGIGGRLDQTFSTINTLFTRPGVYILDTDNVVFLLSAGKHEIDCSGLGRHCGLVPMAGSVKCWSRGLQWCLNGETMTVGGLISTNNRVTDDAGIVIVACDGPVLFSIELVL